MAEKLCTLKMSGGGVKTETVLWTNPSPTSSFSSQTINLNESILNYDYLEFRYKYNKSTQVSDDNPRLMIQAESFKALCQEANYMETLYMGLYTAPSDTKYQFRRLAYTSDSSIKYYDCYINGGFSDVNNDYNVPVSVIGIKYN